LVKNWLRIRYWSLNRRHPQFLSNLSFSQPPSDTHQWLYILAGTHLSVPAMAARTFGIENSPAKLPDLDELGVRPGIAFPRKPLEVGEYRWPPAATGGGGSWER